MKICFVSQTIDPSNGSGRFAHSMISRLASDFGVEAITLIVRGEPATLPNTKAILSRTTFGRICINPFLIAWHARNADIMHAFDGWPCLVMVYLASLLCWKKYTTSLYATYAVEPLLNPKQSMLIKAAYRNCSLNAAISKLTANRITETWSGAKIEVINQGITFGDYQTPLPSPIPDGKKYILTVATIKSRKGYHIAIPAIAEILKTHPDLMYVIVAKREPDQGYYQSIIELIKQSGIEDRIIWKEGISEQELMALYQHAMVFFLPSISQEHTSYFEGFGSVYLEAQSCGTPVITSRGGGQEDAIQDGKTGYLIDEGNINQAIMYLTRIIDSSDVRVELSANSLAFAKSMDWSVVLVDYYERFKSITGKK